MLHIDHNAFPASLKAKSDDELRFIIKDAGEAIAAMPDNPKAGVYADQINYAQMELTKRREKLPATERMIAAQLLGIAFDELTIPEKNIFFILKREGILVIKNLAVAWKE